MITKTTINNLREAINLIYENERSFIERFGEFGSEQITDVLGVAFNDEKLKFTCLMIDGASWVIDCKLTDFNEWCESIEN